MFFERAQGSMLYDVDGREHVDYVCGMGAIILGHSNLYNVFSIELFLEVIRVIPGGRWYLTGSHTERDIDRTLEVVDRVCARMRVRTRSHGRA